MAFAAAMFPVVGAIAPRLFGTNWPRDLANAPFFLCLAGWFWWYVYIWGTYLHRGTRGARLLLVALGPIIGTVIGLLVAGLAGLCLTSILRELTL